MNVLLVPARIWLSLVLVLALAATGVQAQIRISESVQSGPEPEQEIDVIEVTHDAAGRCTGFESVQGESMSFTYDASGKLQTINGVPVVWTGNELEIRFTRNDVPVVENYTFGPDQQLQTYRLRIGTEVNEVTRYTRAAGSLNTEFGPVLGGVETKEVVSGEEGKPNWIQQVYKGTPMAWRASGFAPLRSRMEAEGVTRESTYTYRYDDRKRVIEVVETVRIKDNDPDTPDTEIWTKRIEYPN